MKKLQLGFALMLAGLLPGCATIIEGSGQSVGIATNPPGASCVVDRKGDRLGMVAPTPGSLRLEKSKNDLTVTCKKDGFESATTSQTPRFVGTTFGNIIIGGVVGVIIDAASGANYVYPSEMKLDLAPTIIPIASIPPEVMPVRAGPPTS